jgi:hypothetical protein
MALETLAPPTRQDTATVEPSRAWILGLVVESDGSVSGPGSERALDWPARDEAVDRLEELPEPSAV